MPKYEVSLSNGKKFQVEANQPPSEEDIYNYLEQQSQPQQEVEQEPINEYTGLEKFVVGATPIATSIGGGLLGAVGGLPGIVAGGAAGAGAGRLLADNLESTFGGKEYTSSEMLKRAGGDAAIDALFTVGTFGAGKALKATGGDKVIKKAFKPLTDAIVNMAEPIYRKVGLEEGIKQTKSVISRIEQSVLKNNDDILRKTKLATGLGLKNADEVLTDLSSNIDDTFKALKPELDNGIKNAKKTIQNGYETLLGQKGGEEVLLDTGKIINKIDDIGLDDKLSGMIKTQLGEDTIDPLKGLYANNPAMKAQVLAQMGIDANKIGGAMTVSDAHNLKLAIDNVIGALSSQRDKISKRAIGKLMNVQDDVIESISKATDGIYDDLSKNYRRMFDVEKNINNALGQIGSGAVEGVRGKEIKGNLLKSFKNLKPEDDVFAITDGFLGKINSQINLLEDVGMVDAAEQAKKGILELSSNLLKESDYKNIEKVLKEININADVAEKVSVSDLKKLLKIKDIDKASIQDILGQAKYVKTQGKTIKNLSKSVSHKKEAMSNIREFHSFNDRYMPMIAASTMASFVPVLGAPIRTIAGLYTVYKLRNLGAYKAIQAIEKISSKALKNNLSKQQKVAFEQFVASIINGLRNQEY